VPRRYQNGRSDFNGLHSRRHYDEVQFYAFDILASRGEDLRRLPLSMRKASLARLLARRIDGIFLSDFEQGEIGPDLFRHACLSYRFCDVVVALQLAPLLVPGALLRLPASLTSAKPSTARYDKAHRSVLMRRSSLIE
jgi:hypothetical protein